MLPFVSLTSVHKEPSRSERTHEPLGPDPPESLRPAVQRFPPRAKELVFAPLRVHREEPAPELLRGLRGLRGPPAPWGLVGRLHSFPRRKAANAEVSLKLAPRAGRREGGGQRIKRPFQNENDFCGTWCYRGRGDDSLLPVQEQFPELSVGGLTRHILKPGSIRCCLLLVRGSGTTALCVVAPEREAQRSRRRARRLPGWRWRCARAGLDPAVRRPRRASSARAGDLEP